MLQTKYKRIQFIDVSETFPKRKTKTYHCYANTDILLSGKPSSSAIRLGTVKWHSQWRQYCFFPHQDRWTELIFSGGCSTDIGHFCKQLMEQRKQERSINLTTEQLAIIEHTATRAANGAYCGDSKDMDTLVTLGLMKDLGRSGFCEDHYYSLTDAGRTFWSNHK